MTAPLNNAMACLPVFWESQVEGPGMAVSDEDKDVVPAVTLHA